MTLAVEERSRHILLWRDLGWSQMGDLVDDDTEAQPLYNVVAEGPMEEITVCQV